MVSDLGAHKFVVKVGHNFAWRSAYVRDEVADSREHVVFEGRERVDIFVTCTAIEGKESIFDSPDS